MVLKKVRKDTSAWVSCEGIRKKVDWTGTGLSSFTWSTRHQGPLWKTEKFCLEDGSGKFEETSHQNAL